jgi:hypothetical protein
MALAMLAACAPFGVESPPPQVSIASATLTANVYATGTAASAATVSVSASPRATLPSLQPDAGWMTVVQVADGAKLGGPSVTGSAAGASTASSALTLGAFTLSPAATVALLFGCVSPANVHASLEIGISAGESVKIPCGADANMNRSQMTMTHSATGTKLTVTATISTDSAPPEWNLLVEQPK